MDSKAKMLFVIFLLSVLSLAFFAYEKYILNKDYLISAEIPCDQLRETCFVYHCDPETEQCSGISEEDTSYYKKIEKLASTYPSCDTNKENCLVSDCGVGDSDCVMTPCDVNDAESECSSPEDFSVDSAVSETEGQEDAASTTEEEDPSVIKE